LQQRELHLLAATRLTCGTAWPDTPFADIPLSDRPMISRPIRWLIKESKKVRPNTQQSGRFVRDNQTDRDSGAVDDEAATGCCRGPGIKTVAKLLEA
jgi:hypothetical protein